MIEDLSTVAMNHVREVRKMDDVPPEQEKLARAFDADIVRAVTALLAEYKPRSEELGVSIGVQLSVTLRDIE